MSYELMSGNKVLSGFLVSAHETKASRGRCNLIAPYCILSYQLVPGKLPVNPHKQIKGLMNTTQGSLYLFFDAMQRWSQR